MKSVLPGSGGEKPGESSFRKLSRLEKGLLKESESYFKKKEN